jgi:hypothetical protein
MVGSRRPYGEHPGDEQIFDKDFREFRFMAGRYMQAFGEENLKKQERPDDRAKRVIDEDEIRPAGLSAKRPPQ